jgi:hypothetical protein
VYRVKYFVALIRIARWKAKIQTEANPKHNTTEKALLVHVSTQAISCLFLALVYFFFV